MDGGRGIKMGIGPAFERTVRGSDTGSELLFSEEILLRDLFDDGNGLDEVFGRTQMELLGAGQRVLFRCSFVGKLIVLVLNDHALGLDLRELHPVSRLVGTRVVHKLWQR